MSGRRGLLFLAVVLAAGCASDANLRPGAQNPSTVTSSVNLSGFPPEFRRGFSDGCAAVRASETAQRPKGEAQYVAGWQDGFDYCKPRK
ncbi:MAG TPA: hypothetical protein VML91_07545 [Burkholderiales bacterium]|nr:hypothetical protein [Burkholderiales bacterium]